MKMGAYIFIFILSYFTIKPVFDDLQLTSTPTCATNESCCKKETVPAEKKDCEDPCSPFMGCVNGNFYINEKPAVIITPSRQVTFVARTFNDNRIIEKSSDCWHPPKM